MVYQALYRKWRPRTFDSVVGQTAITDTLKNAIKRQTVSHAFLFAGPRGTGKTSCAKIFAKALNCTNLQDGEPCNQCENCKAADAGSMPDIMEIDAASNNGVDEIRDIRDKVKYAPTQGKYKVYIIDEVHMLSIGAFNALLKTLEEPPEHVVFILATTELQKVPATIISRTQRYNFKRISNEDLVKRMVYILDQEKIDYEPKALDVIAKVADGGMRDALSILDQLLSFEKSKINYDDALKITGFAAKEEIEQILLSLLAKDTVKALAQTQKTLTNGASSKNILDELIELSTNSLMVNKGAKQDTFLTEGFAEKIKNASSSDFFKIIKLANNALNDLRYTNQQQIPLEVFLIQASTSAALKQAASPEQTSADDNQEISLLKRQFADLAQKVAALTQRGNLSEKANDKEEIIFDKNKKAKPVAKKKTRPAKAVKKSDKQNRKQVYQVLENATRKDLDIIKDVWPDLQSVLEVSERAVLDVLEPVAASHSQVVMKCKYTFWFENTMEGDLLGKLQDNIEKFTKNSYQIVLVPDSDWLEVRKDFVQSHKKELLAKKQQIIEEKEAPKDDPKVIDQAKKLFGDAVNIKD